MMFINIIEARIRTTTQLFASALSRSEATTHLKESSMNTWYYEKDGQRLGGLPDAEIAALIQQRAVTSETLVWKQGLCIR